ncbi:MAG: serpin family protein [Thermotogota bacterium]
MMRFRILLVVSVGVMAVALSGCDWLWPDVPSDSVAQSNLARDLDPDVSGDAAAALAAGNGAFAFALYGKIAAGDGNVFFSPFSISSALAMTYAGADGETEAQMADALHFDLAQDALHPAFNAVDLTLNSRDELEEPYEGDGFELSIVNAVWGEQGFPFRDGYLDVLAVSYGAGLRLVDFSGDPEGSRTTINNWVSDQTNDRVLDLLPEGSVSAGTRLVLTNAIYFKAPWLDPFDEDNTKSESFTTLSGSSISLAMMHQTITALYAQVGDVQAVELPYNGGKLAMLLLVPDVGGFESFEEDLTYEKYEEIVGQLEEHRVYLGLPQFEFDYALSLVDALRALGMEDAFDPDAADFSGIDGAHDLYISNVLHKAFVSVDEIGTEAAAATAVVVDVTAIPGESVTLTIDRPFLFVIRDIPTDTILFIGRVVEP